MRLYLVPVLIATAAATTVLMADYPPPHFRLRNQINELKKQAQQLAMRGAAIDGLRRMLEDESVPLNVREEAMIALGGVAGKDDVVYLMKFADKQESNKKIRIAATLALWMARVNFAESESEELLVLTESLAAEFDAKDFNQPRRWAAAELCDRGELIEPDLIRKALDRAYEDQRAAEEMSICETQASLMKGSKTPTEAYLSALELLDMSSRRSLHNWALRHLEEAKDRKIANRLLAYALRMEASDHPFDMDHGVTAAKVVLALGLGRDALLEAGLKQPTVQRAEYRFQFPH